jgi:hypothetical protein
MDAPWGGGLDVFVKNKFGRSENLFFSTACGAYIIGVAGVWTLRGAGDWMYSLKN